MGQRTVQTPEPEQQQPEGRAVSAEKMIERLEAHRAQLMRQVDMLNIMLEESDEKLASAIARITELEGK